MDCRDGNVYSIVTVAMRTSHCAHSALYSAAWAPDVMECQHQWLLVRSAQASTGSQSMTTTKLLVKLLDSHTLGNEKIMLEGEYLANCCSSPSLEFDTWSFLKMWGVLEWAELDFLQKGQTQLRIDATDATLTITPIGRFGFARNFISLDISCRTWRCNSNLNSCSGDFLVLSARVQAWYILILCCAVPQEICFQWILNFELCKYVRAVCLKMVYIPKNNNVHKETDDNPLELGVAYFQINQNHMFWIVFGKKKIQYNIPEISGTFVSHGTQQLFFANMVFFRVRYWPWIFVGRSLQADFEDLTLRSASCLTSDLGPFGYSKITKINGT